MITLKVVFVLFCYEILTWKWLVDAQVFIWSVPLLICLLKLWNKLATLIDIFKGVITQKDQVKFIIDFRSFWSEIWPVCGSIRLVIDELLSSFFFLLKCGAT